MKRTSPIKHKVCSHKRDGKTVRAYARGTGTRSKRIAMPKIVCDSMTLDAFNQKVRSGDIPIDQVNMYRFWYGDSFQDLPARTKSEAKAISESYNKRRAPANQKIELNEFGTQTYRAFLESQHLFDNEKAFERAYLEAKKQRGITKSEGEFWLFKGREYTNVGIPKEDYIKAVAEREAKWSA